MTEDSRDLAYLRRAFIVGVTISDLLWVAKLIPELTDCTVSEGSNITVPFITWPARFVIDSQLKYSVKNVPCFVLANEWNLRCDKQAS